MRRLKFQLNLEWVECQIQVAFVWKVLIFLIVFQSLEVRSIYPRFDSLVGKNTPETIAALGYPVEGHVIRTADNVLLQYFRIPHGRNSISHNGVKPVVLMVHGFLGTSYHWLLQDDDKILPLILAEQGYDVWLANSRGVSYSNRLNNIGFKNTRFWKFTVHEMGIYDIPAAIDYILEVTNQRQLFYIGYSQGTTQFYVMLSERPEYNSKIRLAVSLAPVAYSTHLRGLIKVVSYALIPANQLGLPDFLTSVGLGEIFPAAILEFIHKVGLHVCTLEPFEDICLSALFSVAGFDFEQFNQAKWPHVIGTFPDSSSLREFAYFTQLVTSKRFKKYDYGAIKNLNIYGSVSPPSYNLSRITAPVALFWAINDYNSHPKDVKRLTRELGNVSFSYRIPFDLFSHGDYLFGIDAYSLVYKQVLKAMTPYLSH